MASARNGSVWTISNVITIARILLVPVFVAVLLAPWPDWLGLASFDEQWKRLIGAAVFVAISCTDWVDGYLARSRNEVTDFGKFMDPLADKILVCAALISLVELGSLPTWVVLIILAREFIVSGVRMMAASKGVVIAASMLGKFKTVFQMIAIVLFTLKDALATAGLDYALGDFMWYLSWLVMIVALALTIASMLDYLYKARALLGFEADDGESLEAVEVSQVYDIDALAKRVVDLACEGDKRISTAESLTGGMIGSAITAVPGSSAVFKGGIVSYTNEVKHEVLGVDDGVLETLGAVSAETARQMAEGARLRLDVDLAVSVTGIAGPGGAEPGKPVGTVWIGLSTPEGTSAVEHRFEGDREEVRRQTVAAALKRMLEVL